MCHVAGPTCTFSVHSHTCPFSPSVLALRWPCSLLLSCGGCVARANPLVFARHVCTILTTSSGIQAFVFMQPPLPHAYTCRLAYTLPFGSVFVLSGPPVLAGCFTVLGRETSYLWVTSPSRRTMFSVSFACALGSRSSCPRSLLAAQKVVYRAKAVLRVLTSLCLIMVVRSCACLPLRPMSARVFRSDSGVQASCPLCHRW